MAKVTIGLARKVSKNYQSQDYSVSIEYEMTPEEAKNPVGFVRGKSLEVESALDKLRDAVDFKRLSED